MNHKAIIINRGMVYLPLLFIFSLSLIRIAGPLGLLVFVIMNSALICLWSMTMDDFKNGNLPENRFGQWLISPFLVLRSKQRTKRNVFPVLCPKEIMEIMDDIFHKQIKIKDVIGDFLDSDDGVCMDCLKMHPNIEGNVDRIRCNCGGIVARINFLKENLKRNM